MFQYVLTDTNYFVWMFFDTAWHWVVRKDMRSDMLDDARNRRISSLNRFVWKEPVRGNESESDFASLQRRLSRIRLTRVCSIILFGLHSDWPGVCSKQRAFWLARRLFQTACILIGLWAGSVLPDWAGCRTIGLLLIGLDRRITHWAGRQNLGCF